MANSRSQSRDGNRDSVRGGAGRGDNTEDPPMSRLFVICDKAHTEEDFKKAFSKFGEIEDVWVVKDKQTGDNKGIAYVKFTKTSEAAKAQEEMNGKTLGSVDRPIKVLVASNRSQGSSKSENEHEKHTRLFIVCSKTTTEDELRKEFEKWGTVEHVSVVKDRETGNPKGVSYIRYQKFYDAAVAIEKCPSNYKAVFAEPKGSNPRSQGDQNGGGGNDNSLVASRVGNMGGGVFSNDGSNKAKNDISQFLRMQNVQTPQPTSLEVVVSTSVNQDQLWRLFDIVPGLDYCQITKEFGPRTNEASVVYDSPEAALYAKGKIHGLEFPAGERLIVKVSGMSSSSLDPVLIEKSTKKDWMCSVSLPPSQPMASIDDPVAQRLFIVLTANVPVSILKNVFSCWKGLIDLYLLPNKNCGYVKYADRDSAEKAIEVLNGAEISGARIKVMEAEEIDSGEAERKRVRRN